MIGCIVFMPASAAGEAGGSDNNGRGCARGPTGTSGGSPSTPRAPNPNGSDRPAAPRAPSDDDNNEPGSLALNQRENASQVLSEQALYRIIGDAVTNDEDVEVPTVVLEASQRQSDSASVIGADQHRPHGSGPCERPSFMPARGSEGGDRNARRRGTPCKPARTFLPGCAIRARRPHRSQRTHLRIRPLSITTLPRSAGPDPTVPLQAHGAQMPGGGECGGPLIDPAPTARR